MPKPPLFAAACCAVALLGCDGQTDGPVGTAPTMDPGIPMDPLPTGTVPEVIEPPPEGCAKHPELMPRRIVRLTNAQFQHTTRDLLGPAALEGIDPEDPRQREFQALRVEGDLLNTELLRQVVGLASSAADSVVPRYTEVTGCAEGDDACARGFVNAFAGRSYRRPVTAEELVSITALYDANVAIFSDSPTAGVTEAVRYAVEGILASPGSVYRSELGQPVAGATSVPLDGYELASSISYFLMDSMPDAELMTAAASGALATSDGVRAQVARILQTEAVRENLWRILLAYYELKTVDSTVKDSELFPGFTVGLRNSMYQETALFIRNVMDTGKVDDLLTSRSSFVNESLAELYGLDIVAPADEFVPVELPAEQRSGLLTQASVLAMRARTNDTSIVSRGLYVNGNLLCIERPPQPPPNVLDAVEVQLSNSALTERDRADERAATQPCGGCHAVFDAYGIVLESFDTVGRHRTMYPSGAAINTTSKLPSALGGQPLQTVNELAIAATESGTFSRCVVSNMMKYALSDALGLLKRSDCGVQKTHEAFRASEQTFADLVTQVILSDTLSQRRTEVAQ